MMPSCPPLIPEGANERKILELTNRIIHLLTGEVSTCGVCGTTNAASGLLQALSLQVWKYLGQSAVHGEHHQQITHPERSQAPPVPTDGNEESVTHQEANDVAIHAQLYPQTPDTNGHIEEGTASLEEAVMAGGDGCEPTDLKYNSSALNIKEELVPPIAQPQDAPNSITPQKDGGLGASKLCSGQRSAPRVKEESGLFQEGRAAVTELPTLGQTQQGLPAPIKQEVDSTDAYIQIDYLVPYTDEDSDSPSSDATTVGRAGKCYNIPRQSKNTTERSYKCPECQKCFTRNADLLKHQKAHRQSQSIICSDCGKTFAKNSMYIRHQRIHTGEKPFSCSDCGKSFSVSAHLITHQRIHTGEKPFMCSDCGKSFSQKASLIKHRRTHTGEKPFVCADCGKCFTSSTNLTLHQRVHTGEKPYACSVCGKCFRSSPNLISHQRIHTGEKPYSCTECGKFFTNSSVLVRHQRTHTGEKPFLCSECGKCFTRNSQLLKHQMIHAGQRPYSIT
ncbi:hypothetical protein GDO78_015835 [Eleutherodactylus coqui]|nr:hypothetical protein GDO78_015835 [Eleutherodactylus coqui]